MASPLVRYTLMIKFSIGGLCYNKYLSFLFLPSFPQSYDSHQNADETDNKREETQDGSARIDHVSEKKQGYNQEDDGLDFIRFFVCRPGLYAVVLSYFLLKRFFCHVSHVIESFTRRQPEDFLANFKSIGLHLVCLHTPLPTFKPSSFLIHLLHT
jgi:hypothetical protein